MWLAKPWSWASKPSCRATAPRGGRDIAEGQRQFLQEINAAVEKAFENKTPLEDLVTLEDGAGVATTVELSG